MVETIFNEFYNKIEHEDTFSNRIEIKISEEAFAEYIIYKNKCKSRCNSIKDSVRISELKDRAIKTFNIAGLISLFNQSDNFTITKDDYII
jgi:hypothetical protein